MTTSTATLAIAATPPSAGVGTAALATCEVAEVMAMLDGQAIADVRLTVRELDDRLARRDPARAVRHRPPAVPAATPRAAPATRAGRDGAR